MDSKDLITIALSIAGGGGGAFAAIQVSIKNLEAKIDRHSQSLKAAFAAIDALRADGGVKHEQQQAHIHRLELELARKVK